MSKKSNKTEDEQVRIIQNIVDLYEELGWKTLFLTNTNGEVPAIIGGTPDFIDDVGNSFTSAEAITGSMGFTFNKGQPEEREVFEQPAEEATPIDNDPKKKTFH